MKAESDSGCLAMDPLNLKCPNCGAAAGHACVLGSQVVCALRIQASASPTDVACPECAAAEGLPCVGVRRGKKRELSKVHPARALAAKQAKGHRFGVTFGKLVAQASIKSASTRRQGEPSAR